MDGAARLDQERTSGVHDHLRPLAASCGPGGLDREQREDVFREMFMCAG
jgi:hypothetical protein